MPEDTPALIAQYEQAVVLYQHEDNLTWRKMQQAVYANAAAATAVGVELFQDARWLVAAIAAVLGLIFIITVEGSRRYMFARLDSVYKAEHALCERTKIDRVLQPIRPARFIPTTSIAIRAFLWGTVVIWIALTIAWSR